MINKETELNEALEHGKDCRKGCVHCCLYGTGCLVGDDKKKIATFLDISENKLEEKYLETLEKFNTKLLRPKMFKKDGLPYGPCVFLKEDFGCKIHEVKPLQCKIGTCSSKGEDLSLWFTLNYFVNSKDSESVKQFAQYLKLGGKTLDKGKLKDLVKDDVLRNKLIEEVC
tara:strand:- start:831 stop:1340 length:510 start_codon:yes stop_codon:yes gene_type:complete